MSDLEITMLIQKFANEDDLYSKEVRNLLSEGGIKRLIGQYKNISRRLDNISDENKALKKRIAELESRETKKSSEIDTSTPINCANSLINHLKYLEAFLIAPERYERTFNIDDLEQIAEHLLVYCKHNKEQQCE